MPTYGYRCQTCAHEYEKREGFDAPVKQKCPKCGKQARRMLFAPPVVFKGSGFYKTDSRGSSSGGDSSTEPKTSPAPAADADKGHTHGDGGHTHDTPTTTTTTEAAAAS